MSHWMYTHKPSYADDAHNYNRYKHYDSHLGHFLNPNAHMIYLDFLDGTVESKQPRLDTVRRISPAETSCCGQGRLYPGLYKNLKVEGGNRWDNIFSLEFSWMTY